MTEKVLGFKEKDGYRGKHFTGREREAFWQVKEKDIVPVRLKSESVDLAKLQEWNVEQKRLLAKHRATNAFHEGELSGGIEQLNIMLSWAEKEAKK